MSENMNQTKAMHDEDDEYMNIKHENEDEDDEVVGMKVTDFKTDTTIVTQKASSPACSDLTDNNNDGDDQAPKTFPQKLMDILADEEHNHIISWLPEGNGFIISKKRAFAEKILPKFFKASKFTSFTRKLNRWGFSRIPRGPQTGSYFHKFFHRDKPELCLQMTSNSGNKYQTHTIPQQLLPSIPGVIGPGHFGMNTATVAMGPAAASGTLNMNMNLNMGMPPIFPCMPPPQIMANMTPQQQQAMLQQSMFQFQHMMMQQQQHMQQSMMAAAGNQPNSAFIQTSPQAQLMPQPLQSQQTHQQEQKNQQELQGHEHKSIQAASPDMQNQQPAAPVVFKSENVPSQVQIEDVLPTPLPSTTLELPPTPLPTAHISISQGMATHSPNGSSQQTQKSLERTIVAHQMQSMPTITGENKIDLGSVENIVTTLDNNSAKGEGNDVSGSINSTNLTIDQKI